MKDKKAAPVTQAEFARMIGVSKQYVNKLVRQGVIRLTGKKINVADARKRMRATSDPVRTTSPATPRRGGGGAEDLTAIGRAKLADLTFSAKIKETKYKKLIEQLVDLTAYNQAIISVLGPQFSFMRNYILSIDKRVAVKWPNPDQRAMLQTFLRAEMLVVLENLSDPELAEIKEEFDECKKTT